MVPLDKYYKVFNLSRLAAKAVGIDSFNPNFKITPRTIGAILCVIIYFPCIFYSLYVQMFDGWHVLVNTLCLVGSALQGTIKLYVYIAKKTQLRRLYQTLANMYSYFQEKNLKYIEILIKISRRTDCVVKIASIGYLTVMLSLLVVPFAYRLITEKNILIMELIIPGLNCQETWGFLGTAVIHATIIIYGGIGMLSTDTIFFIFILHTRMYAELLKTMFQDLNEILSKKEIRRSRATLKDCLILHQSYCRYLQEVGKVHFSTLFVQIYCTAISILVSIFTCLAGKWPPSYAYLGLCLSVLIVYCTLGTTIEINNNLIYQSICEVHWYDLPVSEQKIILIMLAQAGRNVTLSIGGFAPLSVGTGLKILKAIYSCTMLFLQFVNDNI